jgi:hypothetical protein
MAVLTLLGALFNTAHELASPVGREDADIELNTSLYTTGEERFGHEGQIKITNCCGWQHSYKERVYFLYVYH